MPALRASVIEFVFIRVHPWFNCFLPLAAGIGGGMTGCGGFIRNCLPDDGLRPCPVFICGCPWINLIKFLWLDMKLI